MTSDAVKVAIFLFVWMVITALRSMYARPYEPTWFLGISATLIAGGAAGYCLREYVEHRKRK